MCGEFRFHSISALRDPVNDLLCDYIAFAEGMITDPPQLPPEYCELDVCVTTARRC